MLILTLSVTQLMRLFSFVVVVNRASCTASWTAIAVALPATSVSLDNRKTTVVGRLRRSRYHRSGHLLYCLRIQHNIIYDLQSAQVANKLRIRSAGWLWTVLLYIHLYSS